MSEYYLPEDFVQAPKYNAHMHYMTYNGLYARKAKKTNIHLITINTDFDVISRDAQFEISQIFHQRYPQNFDFICTFDASAFASKTFAEDAIEHIKKHMLDGARGVKIWKNIGMSLKDEAGQYIMADNPVFDPIYTFLQKEKIPLLAHLGEPRDCWLPLDRMSNKYTMKYYSENPKFHAYLHPEVPSYEQQIAARDRILERFPDLIFVGAHLGSMEWSLEEVAKRFDRFHNFYIDLSGRFDYVYAHAFQNKNSVIEFFKKYRNKIIYGTDCFIPRGYQGKTKFFSKYFPQIYMNLLFRKSYQTIKEDWLFLATDNAIKPRKINDNAKSTANEIEGLKLSKNIVDSIFYKNTQFIYYNKES